MRNLFMKMLALTLALGGVLSTRSAQLIVKAEDGYTDITQVKITTDETIEKGSYKKAKISISDANNASYNLTTTDIKIKIRGNSTSGLDKKPYNIKFDKKTSIFGWAKGKKYCFLANRYDKSLIRNYLAFKLSSQLRLAYTVSYKFVDLWLNGVYKGNYFVTTPIETGKNRLNIETDGNDVLLEREGSRSEEDVTYLTSPIYKLRFAVNDPETPTSEQLQSYNELLTKAENAMKSHDYDEIVKYIDVDSFTDFFILEEYLKQLDVDYSSTRYYIKDNKLYASPAWDYDLSAGNANPNVYKRKIYYSSEGLYALTTVWMRNLMQCDAFKKQFVNRFNDLSTILKNLYDNDIDEITDKYKDAFERDSAVAGWSLKASGLDRTPENTYMGNVNFLKNWLKKRYVWLYAYFNDNKSLDYDAYDKAVSLVSSLAVNDAVDHTALDNALSADLLKEGVTQDEIDAMTADILDAGLEYSKNLTDYLNTQLNETKNSLSKVQEQLTETNDKLSTATDSLSAAQKQLDEQTKANEAAKTENDSLKKANEEKEAELDEVKAQLKTANDSLTETQAKLTETNDKLSTATDSLSTAQKQLDEQTKANEAAKTENDSLKKANEEKEAELNEVKAQLKTANDSLTETQAKLTETNDKLNTTQKQLNEKTKANEAKGTELTDVKAKLAAAQKEVQKLKASTSKKIVHASSINISNKTKKVKAKAYKDNKYLKTVTIPSSVTEIGAQAFYNCKNVNKIVIKSKKLKKIGKQAFKKTGSVNYKKLVVTVPKKKVKAYKKMLVKAGLSSKAIIRA